MINKLIRQYGEHGNEYSPVEMGDKINEIIDWLMAIDRASGNPPSVDTPVSQEQEKEIEAVMESAVELPKDLTRLAARSSATGDRVYLLIPDVKIKSWIKNPETLEKLGFKFSDVKDISNAEMDGYEVSQSTDLSEKKPLEVIKPIDGIDKYNL